MQHGNLVQVYDLDLQKTCHIRYCFCVCDKESTSQSFNKGEVIPLQAQCDPFYRKPGGPQGRSGRVEKSHPHRDSILDRLTHSQSLYQLSYPAHSQSFNRYPNAQVVLVEYSEDRAYPSGHATDCRFESYWGHWCLSPVVVVYCIASSLCSELITHWEKFYWVCVSNCVWSRNFKTRQPRPNLDCSATEERKERRRRKIESILWDSGLL